MTDERKQFLAEFYAAMRDEGFEVDETPGRCVRIVIPDSADPAEQERLRDIVEELIEGQEGRFLTMSSHELAAFERLLQRRH